MSDAPTDPIGCLPDFSGKLVAFYVADPSRALSGGVFLEYPEFKVLGGRLFVVGRSPQIHGLDWASNLPATVAWDSVIHYLVFDSREDYLARGKRAPGGFLHRLFHRMSG